MVAASLMAALQVLSRSSGLKSCLSMVIIGRADHIRIFPNPWMATERVALSAAAEVLRPVRPATTKCDMPPEGKSITRASLGNGIHRLGQRSAERSTSRHPPKGLRRILTKSQSLVEARICLKTRSEPGHVALCETAARFGRTTTRQHRALVVALPLGQTFLLAPPGALRR